MSGMRRSLWLLLLGGLTAVYFGLLFEWEKDGKHIREVTNAKLVDTHFRSPQLSLFDLGPDEWLLCLRVPEYAPRKQNRITELQAPLFDPAPAVGQ